MDKPIKSLVLGLSMAILIPSAAYAYQDGLRDPETGLDCNQQQQMLKVAGADTHPHQIQNIHKILKRCDTKEREAMNTTTPVFVTPTRD